ncbi:MAG: DNA-binding protein [Ruminococcus sp.]|nr:DNA-binding protein [Ruminococcus sp.]
MKDLRMALLLDCYGEFLTKRQYEFTNLYYCEDFSLGEIASKTDVSRQAVSNSIKRSEHILLEMEEKLQFASKICRLRDNYTQISELAQKLISHENANPDIKELGDEILRLADNCSGLL